MASKIDDIIRKALRESENGMTLGEIKELLPSWHSGPTIHERLRSMPDTYVDHWTKKLGGSPKTYPYVQVWSIVVPPPDCPRPAIKGGKYDQEK
jgi:hypothetical protein